MIYKDMSDLLDGINSVDPTDTRQLETFRHLLGVYTSALNNPPDGVIGVGAITYAQGELVAAQVTP